MNEIEMKILDLSDYRAALYASFDYRADARMDLLDALLSNVTAQSVVALSLSPFFQRQYSSIPDVIDVTMPLYLNPTAVLNDDQLPFQDDLTVAVEDSKYSVVNHLGRVFPNDNLVVIARSRGQSGLLSCPPIRP